MALWHPLGDRAIRFARPVGASGARVSARTIVREVRAWHNVVDVVVTADEVAVYFEPTDRENFSDMRDIGGEIRALANATDTDEPVRDHLLRVRYDGVDLDEVARATGLTPDEVIAIHSGATYTVDTIGFAPGFAYLAGLDPRLELPRRATPRPRVPAGSVAIAGAQSAVYPFASPGGWHLLGSVVGVSMFDSSGPLLALADRVRFAPEPSDGSAPR